MAMVTRELRELHKQTIINAAAESFLEKGFTNDVKVEAFLKNSLRIYYVPDEKIEEAIVFVKTIDFKQAAKENVDSFFLYLEKQRENLQKIYKGEIL